MKFQAVFILLFLLLPCIGNSQGNKTKVKKDVYLGINYSADYANRLLANLDGSQSSESMINSRNARENAKYGHTGGFLIKFVSNKKFEFETGLNYSNKGYSAFIDGNNLIFPDQIDPMTGQVKPTAENAESYSRKYIHHYLDVPLKLTLLFGTGKWRYTVSSGLIGNFLMHSNIRTKTLENDGKVRRNSTENQNYNFKNFNLSFMFGTGLDCTLNEKYSFRVEPTFRYGTMKIIDAPITAYLWNVGLNLACYYKIK